MKALSVILFAISFSCVNAQTTTDENAGYLEKHALSPQQYVIEKFKTNDVILLGEQHMVKQNLLFVQELIPLLYKNGIYTIGMEFGANENQGLMDSLVTAKFYNEKLAEKMMFDYNVTWAYKEYVEMAKAAWEFNRTLPVNARPFRILNLSYIYDWQKFRGKRDAETMREVFAKGTADQFRAALIEKEIIDKKEKILALVGTPHAYTKYGSAYFLFNADNFYAYDHQWLGSRLYAKYPGKIFNIILHQAFTKKADGKYIPVSPLDGQIETLMLQQGNKPAGFDLINSPIGKLKDNSIHATGYENFTIGQLFDGYIFLKPLQQLESCTVIPGFVNERNIDKALKQFPDPDWHPKISNLQEMIKFIESNVKMIRF